MRSLIFVVGAVGWAVLASSAAAQATSIDSARAARDTSTSDTARARTPKADSILLSYHPDTTKVKSPIARAEQPRLLSVGPSYHWNRQQLFASGALTLADLLAEIPGVTTLSGGWISAPMVALYGGDAARLRIFYDGIELDPLNAETQNIHDLSTIELWTLEEVGIEQAAGEIRVYLRSWRVDNLTPVTRADVLTGNQETNLYRAFLGKRFSGGEALQFAAQQFTNVARYGGGGSGTSLLGRIGWASGPWSFDAFADRYRRGRDALTRVDPNTGAPLGTGLPDFEGTWTNAYVRAGYGNPDNGPWAQLIASSQEFKNSSPVAPGVTVPVTSGATAGVPTTTAAVNDTANSEAQYVATGGLSKWGIRFTGTERIRILAGHGTSSSPALRLSYSIGPLALQGYTERNVPSAWPTTDTLNRNHTIPINVEDVQARLTPLPFFSVVGTATRTTSNGAIDAPPTSLTLRGEAGVRLKGVWVSGGVITRDTARVPGLALYDTTYAPAALSRTTGYFASVRGAPLSWATVDLEGINWGSEGPYRPHYQGRAQLSLESELLHRFPRHTFAIKASGIMEYSSPMLFPTTGGTSQFSTGAVVLSTLLEIRILQGTLTWQLRNALGYPYDLVPGFFMPRQTNIYGIRWSFWN